MKDLSPDLLEEVVGRLVQCLHPEQIILFGSHAYGKPTVESDIDLLIVVSDSNEPRYRRARKAYGCLRGLSAPTELIELTRREVAQSANGPVSFVRKALQRGRVLYAR